MQGNWKGQVEGGRDVLPHGKHSLLHGKYRIYPCISPGPIQGHKVFWWAYTQGGLYTGGPIHEYKKVVSFGKA